MTSTSWQQTFLNFFPIPEFLLLSTSGIMITDTDIKFVRLHREIFGGGYKIAHSVKMDVPGGAVESGLINNPEAIKTILRDLSTRYGIRYAHAVLPEEKAYIFTKTIGWVPKEGLRDAVAFIVEENAPVTLAGSVFDFEIVSENKRTEEIKVTVSVLPENIVSYYTELFESAGITPVSFGLEPQAVARAVIHRGDNGAYLILNLSLKKTGFYAVDNSVVQFSETESYGVGGSDPYSNLENIKTEMQKILGFLSGRMDKRGLPENKITKIIICGPGAGNKDFVDKLMSGTTIDYAVADACLNMSKDHRPKMSPAESLDYASVIGLVLARGE